MPSHPEDVPRRRLDDLTRRPATGWTPTPPRTDTLPAPQTTPLGIRRHVVDRPRDPLARRAPGEGDRDGRRVPQVGETVAGTPAPGSSVARADRSGAGKPDTWPADRLPPDPMGEVWAPDDAGRRARAADSGSSTPGPAGPARAPWDVGAALATARDGYAASHGRSPLDAADDVDLGDPVVRPRRDGPHVRWLVSWRVATTAAVVVVLAAGAVAVRASMHASGPVVAIPEPVATSVPGARDAAARDDPATGPSAGATDVTATASTPGAVVVHVVGAVAAPGVVRLPDGARVGDALTAAGGATADADLSTVNLARLVVDGEQVLVLRVGEQAAPGAGAQATGPATGAGADPAAPVDLNSADVAALDALPGIGPVLAQRIVDHRAGGPFGTVDELADVRGIGPALLENLRPLVRV